MKFYTWYNRPEQEFEQLSDELVVERGGYVDTKTQIENFIRSGELLVAARKARYEFPEQMEEDENDEKLPVPPIYGGDMVDQDEFIAATKAAKERIYAEQVQKKQQNSVVSQSDVSEASIQDKEKKPLETLDGGSKND